MIDLTKFAPLSGSAREVMRCLFIHGPTWDGDVPSKSGRNELMALGLAERAWGFAWLTCDGVQVALDFRLDREKERWRNRGRTS
jgi:hypothetical protein